MTLNKPSQGENRRKNILKTVLTITITIVIFYVIFSKIDFFSVIDVLAHANLWYLFIAFLLTILIFVIQTKRWKIVLDAMGYNIQYLECFCMVMGAYPLASVTPSKAGDLVKAYYIKDKIPISKTVGSVLTEKALDIFILLLLCLIGLAFYPRLWMQIIAVIIIIGIIVFFVLSHLEVKHPTKKSWNDKLQNMLLSTRALTKDKKKFFVGSIATFALWFIAIIQTVIFFFTLGIDVPLLFTMANIPIAIFVGMIPVTIGGMGTRDSAIILLFSNYGDPSELLSVGILFSLFRYWLPSLMGIPFMQRLLR
jgi:uncharacterized protein (TIRG00374 family)